MLAQSFGVTFLISSWLLVPLGSVPLHFTVFVLGLYHQFEEALV